MIPHYKFVLFTFQIVQTPPKEMGNFFWLWLRMRSLYKSIPQAKFRYLLETHTSSIHGFCWRNHVSKNHRNRSGRFSKHVCPKKSVLVLGHALWHKMRIFISKQRMVYYICCLLLDSNMILRYPLTRYATVNFTLTKQSI